MKILIPLSAALMLASCPQPDQKKKEPEKKAPDVHQQQGMDSPITVSDGSTHLRHGSFIIKDEQNPDDSNKYEIHAHVTDPGFMAYKVRCSLGCSSANPTNLTPLWKVELWNDLNASSHKLGVMKSGASAGDVKTHFFGKPIDPEPDPLNTGSTDIIMNAYTLRSAVLYNNGAAMPTASFKCDTASANVRCTITINYCNDPTVATCQ